VLSPSRRLLLCSGEPVPLIPRYFDLLMLLIERRNEAVPRSEILEEVWHDVVVSDGALNQAVRVLRRALGDDPKSPRFIRTVARHGYRFIHEDIVEEADDATLPEDDLAQAAGSQLTRDQRFERALRSLLDSQAGENDRREAA
jgi:DNA-binding winged helix-turn-helix (wHTH) protein